MPMPKQLVEGGHAFITNDDGTIDHWQYEGGFHNGPRCENCKVSWCEHCEPEIYEEQCPNNNIIVVHETERRKELSP